MLAKKRKTDLLELMGIKRKKNHRVITLEFSFSNTDGKNKSKTIVFEKHNITTASWNKLIISRFLSKAKFDGINDVVSFDIRLYSAKQLEKEKFDKNNDYAYLYYRNFLTAGSSKDSDKVVDLGEYLKTKKLAKKEKIDGKKNKETTKAKK